jgi:hypothetical protein
MGRPSGALFYHTLVMISNRSDIIPKFAGAALAARCSLRGSRSFIDIALRRKRLHYI